MICKIGKDCVVRGVKVKAGDEVEVSEVVAQKLKARGFLEKPKRKKDEEE